MKKTLSINLNGIVFNIEEDAYDKLEEYLDSIKEYFASYESSQEILNDIEARAAEQFGTKISSAKQALTLADVEELIKTMGTVEAIAGEEKSSADREAPAKRKYKKFYRDMDNAMLCGVASGIAAHFNFDTILVRLAFAISVLFGGTGIVVYIILCFIMPEAKTTANKMEMRGEPVTLSSLKDAAMDKIETAKENIKKDRYLPKINKVMFKIMKIFALVIFIIIGVSIVVSAVAGLVGLFVGFGIAMFNANSPFIDFPVRELFPGAIFYLFMLAAFFAAAIPLVFLLLLGTTMTRRKATINLISGLILLMIWAISVSVSGALAIRIAPQFEEKLQAIEKTEIISRAFKIQDFNQIDVDGLQNLIIVKGDEFKIEATGRQQELDRTIVNKTGQTLEIKKNYPWQVCLFCFAYRNSLTFKITMPALESYKGVSFSKADISGFSEENLEIRLDGVGETKADIFAKNLSLDMNGVSRLILTGSSTSALIKLDGVANLDASSFPTNVIQISTNGASRANIWATEKLDAKTDGASHVFYKGTPALSQETKGVSKVEPAE